MSKYTMPPAFVGQMIQYFHQKGGDPLAAVVQGLGTETIKLGAWEPEHQGITFFDGVRHASDPNEHAKRSSGYGEWDYCPTSLVENQLRCDIAALRSRLSEELQDLKAYFDAALKAYQQAHGQIETRMQALEDKFADLSKPPQQMAEHKKKAA